MTYFDCTARLGATWDFEVWTYDSDNSTRMKLGLAFCARWLKWTIFNSERMELPIGQRWCCSVGSPCIAEAIHWSQPLHKVEKLLSWKFGVSAFCFCKVILKTSSVTKRLQCLCCQPTIHHRFVDTLPRYDLFWWPRLVPEKISFCLQHSGTKYQYFIWAKRSTAGRVVMAHSTCSNYGASFAAATCCTRVCTPQQQVPQHFDCSWANGSLYAKPVARISFISYDAD